MIRNACVVSLDPSVGDFERADILVRGSIIEAVRPNIEVDADEIDATDMIAFPGFVDSHRHCWQNVYRRFAPNATVSEYRTSSNAIADAMRPEDVYIGVLLACYGAIDSGITTLLDWSHISNTPEHSDAAIEALFASGIRGIFGYAHSRSAYPGSRYPQDLRRLRKEYFSSDDQLVRLFLGADIERQENWALARELDLRITCHAWRQNDLVEKAGRAKLLGSDITMIHCTGLGATAWQMMADSGVSISLAPNSVMQLGVGGGISPIQDALDHGIRPSLSGDTETVLPGDFFTQMRVLLALQRGLANQRRFDGDPNSPSLLSVRDVLGFATVEGAKANGLSSVTGTLTPGKAADIVLIRNTDANTMPLNNAIGTIVSGADRGNIDTVLVAGKVRKRHGRLVDVDLAALKAAVEKSRNRVSEESGYWPDVLGPGHGNGLAIPDPTRDDLMSRKV